MLDQCLALQWTSTVQLVQRSAGWCEVRRGASERPLSAVSSVYRLVSQPRERPCESLMAPPLPTGRPTTRPSWSFLNSSVADRTPGCLPLLRRAFTAGVGLPAICNQSEEQGSYLCVGFTASSLHGIARLSPPTCGRPSC